MKKKVVPVVVALTLCATMVMASPKLELKWTNPNYAGGPFKNILVLALNGKAANRAEFEDELVAAISRQGSTASPSYEFMPRPNLTPIDKNDLRELIKEQKFDALVVACLTKKDTKITEVPGQVWTPFPYYGTFYGYYSVVAPVVYTPGYLETERQAQVEVNFYSTAKPDGELIWTGTTNTFDVSSVKTAIKDLVKVVSNELEKEKIVEKRW